MDVRLQRMKSGRRKGDHNGGKGNYKCESWKLEGEMKCEM
jgi:hypothetical protein